MRDKSIDTVGGIMILFMIYRHCVTATEGLGATYWGAVATYYPLLFCMAWFFFKSGMFFKGEDTLEQTITKGMVRLLIPYLCFSLISVCVSLTLNGILHGEAGVAKVLSGIPVHLKREGAIECNMPVWFLLSLFFVRVYFSAALHLRVPALCTALVSLGFAFGLYRLDLPIGLYFENIALGLCFFSLGFFFKEKQYSRLVFLISMVLFFGYLIYCFCTKKVIGEFIINTHTPYIPTIIFYLAGCVFIDNLFKRVPCLNGEFLNRIGKDSMTYYITHFIIIDILFCLNKALWNLPDWPFLLLQVIVLFAVLPPLAKLFAQPKLRWMVGGSSNLVNAIHLNPTIAWCSVASVALVMLTYLAFHI